MKIKAWLLELNTDTHIGSDTGITPTKRWIAANIVIYTIQITNSISFPPLPPSGLS